MMQRMKKLAAKLLICVSLILTVMTSVCFAAEQLDEETAEMITGYAQKSIEAVVGLSDEELFTYAGQFAMNGSKDTADGLLQWHDLSSELGEYIGSKSTAISEENGCFNVVFEIDCEKQDAVAAISIDSLSGQITALHFEKVETLGEKLKYAFMNLLIGMGTVFAVLVFIAFIISRFKYINEWATANERLEKAEKEYEAKVKEILSRPARMDDVMKRITPEMIRNAVIPADVTVQCISAPEIPAEIPAETAQDDQLTAVLTAAIAAFEAEKTAAPVQEEDPDYIDPEVVAVIAAALEEYRKPQAGPDGLIVRSIRRLRF